MWTKFGSMWNASGFIVRPGLREEYSPNVLCAGRGDGMIAYEQGWHDLV